MKSYNLFNNTDLNLQIHQHLQDKKTADLKVRNLNVTNFIPSDIKKYHNGLIVSCLGYAKITQNFKQLHLVPYFYNIQQANDPSYLKWSTQNQKFEAGENSNKMNLESRAAIKVYSWPNLYIPKTASASLSKYILLMLKH